MGDQMEEFVCTKCWLHFECPPSDRRCPECGDTYGHFFTMLARANSTALGYDIHWARKEGREVNIRSLVPKREQRDAPAEDRTADAFARRAQAQGGEP